MKTVVERTRLRRGFTLVELLVCMAISAVMAGIVASLCLNGSEAAEEAAKRGQWNREAARFRLTLKRDVANAVDARYAPFEGDRDEFVLIARGAGSGGGSRLGVVTYRTADPVVVRAWQPFGREEAEQTRYELGPARFEYLTSHDADAWSASLLASNAPAAVQCVLMADRRVTALRQLAAPASKEDTP